MLSSDHTNIPLSETEILNIRNNLKNYDYEVLTKLENIILAIRTDRDHPDLMEDLENVYHQLEQKDTFDLTHVCLIGNENVINVKPEIIDPSSILRFVVRVPYEEISTDPSLMFNIFSNVSDEIEGDVLYVIADNNFIRLTEIGCRPYLTRNLLKIWNPSYLHQNPALNHLRPWYPRYRPYSNRRR
jgi:hypothetical protein